MWKVQNKIQNVTCKIYDQTSCEVSTAVKIKNVFSFSYDTVIFRLLATFWRNLGRQSSGYKWARVAYGQVM
jgi:hypothetical protein